MITVFVDVDGVVANLHAEWLRRYNEDYGDFLTPNAITDWSVMKFVRPECGDKIFDYLRLSDLYDGISPIEGAHEGVAALRSLGFRVVFATSCVRNQADAKWHWLETHGFLEKKHSQHDLVVIADKGLLYGAALVDDAPKNLNSFQGLGVLFDQPWNRRHIRHQRAHGWENVVNVLRVAVGR